MASSADILPLATNIDAVGIDEAQFFDNDLVNVCNHLANKGVRVIVAGLDMDYLGKPFGPIPQLMATAEHVTKVHAICVKCGNLANYSHRINQEETLVLVGEAEALIEPGVGIDPLHIGRAATKRGRAAHHVYRHRQFATEINRRVHFRNIVARLVGKHDDHP